MENVTQNAADQAGSANTATETKEKKPRKMKKMKREDFVIGQVKAGVRDAVLIASSLADAASKGEVSMKKNHKVPPTPTMWFLQVKWYFHQAKKKGLVEGDLIVPPREKKPRKPRAPKQDAAPAGSTSDSAAPSGENVAGGSDQPATTTPPPAAPVTTPPPAAPEATDQMGTL